MAGRPTFVLYTFVSFVYSISLHFPFCYSYISTFVRSYISFNPPSSLSFLYIRTFLLLDCALFVLSYMSACLLAHSYIRFRTFVALELGNQWRIRAEISEIARLKELCASAAGEGFGGPAPKPAPAAIGAKRSGAFGPKSARARVWKIGNP